MNLNKVFIIGNLTRDPERKSLPSGQAVVNFGVATNRVYISNGQKQQEVEFHNIVAFGKTAEIIAQYLKKGSSVLIEGRLRTRNWVDASGVKHYRTEIITDRMQLGPKPGGFSNFAGNSPAFTENPNPRPTNNINISQEEIPVVEDSTTEESVPPSQFDETTEQEIDVNSIPF